MTEPIIPAQDPADDASMASMLAYVIKRQLMQTDGMLPATVVAYDRASNRATVAPSVNMVTTAGASLPRAPLASIPVLALGGGDFCITFPLKPGDTGWIEASDRDTSLWLQGSGSAAANPNTHRIHSFSDGRFIPDLLGKYTLAPDADDAMCIQNKEGTVSIRVSADRIDLDAPGGVWINGIRMDTHTHGGVQIGGDNTGIPE
jgi:hypothetical protein